MHSQLPLLCRERANSFSTVSSNSQLIIHLMKLNHNKQLNTVLILFVYLMQNAWHAARKVANLSWRLEKKCISDSVKGRKLRLFCTGETT